MAPAGGHVRAALIGRSSIKYKELIASAEKGKARKEAVKRQQAFAASLDQDKLKGAIREMHDCRADVQCPGLYYGTHFERNIALCILQQ